MEEINKNEKRLIWQQPWGYAEAFIIAIGLLFIGLLLDFFSNGEILTLPVWPNNAIIGVSYVVFLILFFSFFKSSALVKWFTGIPASTGAICLFALLTLLMGFIEQTESNSQSLFPEFNHIRRSWPFLLASMYLLSTLALVILHRLSSFSFKNIGFAMNHLGLWIIIFAASLGSGDLKRYQIQIEEGQTTYYGYDLDGKIIKFPFTIKLIDFNITEYPAKLALVNYETNQINTHIKNNPALVQIGDKVKMGDFDIVFKEYFPFSIPDSNGFKKTKDTMSSPACFITVINKNESVLDSGWVSCGSKFFKPTFLPVSKQYYLTMLFPEPKKYRSNIVLTEKNQSTKNVTVEVNKPVKFMGWNLYQVGYDSDKGKDSKLSILEAVSDPWLPVIYIGIFMLIAGALYLFWIGKNIGVKTLKPSN
jgi:hypothetical protein